MLPHEPIPIGPWEQESFVVEVRSISGYSGSPVFYSLHGYFEGLTWLLGINWGHLHTRQQLLARNAAGEFVKTDMWVETNTGQATVVPAWKLKELLFDDAVRATRAKEDGQLAKRLSESPAAQDWAPDNSETRLRP